MPNVDSVHIKDTHTQHIVLNGSVFFTSFQSSKDNLEFHDSDMNDDVLFDKSGQTHTFVNFPTSAVDDEEEDGGDKSQVTQSSLSVISILTNLTCLPVLKSNTSIQ